VLKRAGGTYRTLLDACAGAGVTTRPIRGLLLRALPEDVARTPPAVMCQITFNRRLTRFALQGIFGRGAMPAARATIVAQKLRSARPISLLREDAGGHCRTRGRAAIEVRTSYLGAPAFTMGRLHYPLLISEPMVATRAFGPCRCISSWRSHRHALGGLELPGAPSPDGGR